MIGEIKNTVEHQLRGLSWDTICGLACKAMINGMTFDQLVERALRECINERNGPHDEPV